MSNNYHPSNHLFRGECHTFQEAIATFIEQYQHEKALLLPTDEEAQFEKLLDEGIEIGRRLQAEYNEALKRMEKKLILKWREENGLVFEVSCALASGDYSRLAI